MRREGVAIGGSKTWTNSSEVGSRLRKEIRRKNWCRTHGLRGGESDPLGEIIHEGMRAQIERRQSHEDMGGSICAKEKEQERQVC